MHFWILYIHYKKNALFLASAHALFCLIKCQISMMVVTNSCPKILDKRRLAPLYVKLMTTISGQTKGFSLIGWYKNKYATISCSFLLQEAPFNTSRCNIAPWAWVSVNLKGPFLHDQNYNWPMDNLVWLLPGFIRGFW